MPTMALADPPRPRRPPRRRRRARRDRASWRPGRRGRGTSRPGRGRRVLQARDAEPQQILGDPRSHVGYLLKPGHRPFRPHHVVPSFRMFTARDYPTMVTERVAYLLGRGVLSRAARLLEMMVRVQARPLFAAVELAEEFGSPPSLWKPSARRCGKWPAFTVRIPAPGLSPICAPFSRTRTGSVIVRLLTMAAVMQVQMSSLASQLWDEHHLARRFARSKESQGLGGLVERQPRGYSRFDLPFREEREDRSEVLVEEPGPTLHVVEYCLLAVGQGVPEHDPAEDRQIRPQAMPRAFERRRGTVGDQRAATPEHPPRAHEAQSSHVVEHGIHPVR